jgi:hypothetical protein
MSFGRSCGQEDEVVSAACDLGGSRPVRSRAGTESEKRQPGLAEAPSEGGRASQNFWFLGRHFLAGSRPMKPSSQFVLMV